VDEVVEEAEGFRLHLSSKAATGYRGVISSGNRYRVEYRRHYLGCFATAVEAAVVYARHAESAADADGADGGGDEDGQADRAEEEAMVVAGTVSVEGSGSAKHCCMWSEEEESRLSGLVDELRVGSSPFKWSSLALRLGTKRTPGAIQRHWNMMKAKRRRNGFSLLLAAYGHQLCLYLCLWRLSGGPPYREAATVSYHHDASPFGMK